MSISLFSLTQQNKQILPQWYGINKQTSDVEKTLLPFRIEQQTPDVAASIPQSSVKETTDVAAIIAQNNKIKKHETTDAAAVLAMSSQPPLSSGQKDLCVA